MSEFFEVMSETEFRKANIPRSPGKGNATEPRTLSTWFALPTSLGKCQVPLHDQVFEALTEAQKAYRVGMTLRMVYEIDGILVCRDCFIAEADRD